MSSKQRYLMTTDSKNQSFMKTGLKEQKKWAVFVILLAMAFSSNLVFSEAVTLSSSSVQPGYSTVIFPAGRRLLQKQDTGNDISAIFSGIYGYAMGVLWFVIGVIYMLYLGAKSCCFRNKKGKPKNRKPIQMKRIFFLERLAWVFAVLAMIASVIALIESRSFQSSAKTIMTVITNTADQASSSMYNATQAMRKISVILKQSANVDANQAANFLASSSDKLSYAATGIKKQAQNSRNLVGKLLNIMYILTCTTICLNLASMTAGIGLLRCRRVVYTLVILCWILTILCWMLFGVYFFIERLSEDTCTALHDFQQNPDNNSLSTILPCKELLSVRTVLTDVSTGLYQVINQVNSEISTLRANSLPGLNYVCNPFSGPPDFRYQPKDCPADSIRIGDFPKELKMFRCSGTTEVKCKEGFITTSEYNVIESYTTPVQNLLDTYPEMENLVNCQLVKDAFSDILVHYCKPLQKHIKTTYVSILLLSIAMMVMISVWTRTILYEQLIPNGSVNPNIVL